MPETTLKRICIAEDNPDLQHIFSSIFNTITSFEIHSVTNGHEALNYIHSHAPDLLVLDINMPQVSGLEVLREIQNNPDLAEMKVIVVTGNPQAQTAPEIERADLFLVKPIKVLELRTFVERFLNTPANN